jgi:protein-disulfide isomerase
MELYYMYTPRSHIFAAILSACCVLSTSAMAQKGDENAPVTHKELPALIKQILLDDPSILLEVSEKMQASHEEKLSEKSKEAIIKNKKELYSDPDSPVSGADNADVTVIEFFDYRCGYCKQALSTIQKLLENDKKVRVVFKEYPILSDESKLAARAALAVNIIAKDKYFDFHKAMFDIDGSISNESILAEAKKLGIDTDKLKKELSNPKIDAALAKNKELGAAIGALGTPAIVIGDNFYPGAIPYELMKKSVDELRISNKK